MQYFLRENSSKMLNFFGWHITPQTKIHNFAFKNSNIIIEGIIKKKRLSSMKKN